LREKGEKENPHEGMFVYSLKAICYSTSYTNLICLVGSFKFEILKTIKLHFIDLLRDIHSSCYLALREVDDDDCQIGLNCEGVNTLEKYEKIKRNNKNWNNKKTKWKTKHIFILQ
jgi:hypothetical protein